MSTLRWWEVVALLLGWIIGPPLAEGAEIRRGTASFYTIDSAIREGTCTDAAHRRCLMANGRPLNDEAFTAASRNYSFGTRLLVMDGRANRRRIVVTVTDRGPARSLYRRGRLLDLSQAAFAALAPVSQGVMTVTVERIP